MQHLSSFLLKTGRVKAKGKNWSVQCVELKKMVSLYDQASLLHTHTSLCSLIPHYFHYVTQRVWCFVINSWVLRSSWEWLKISDLTAPLGQNDWMENVLPLHRHGQDVASIELVVQRREFNFSPSVLPLYMGNEQHGSDWTIHHSSQSRRCFWRSIIPLAIELKY